MPLPVAHALIGASVAAAYRPDRPHGRAKVLALGALLGVLPDFDYVLNLVRVFGRGWHHDFTHSFAFALLTGLLAALLLGGARLRSAAVFGLATLSHTLLDYVMTESRGVELFWPLSDRRLRLGIANPIDYTWKDPTLWGSVLELLRISLVELIVFAPVLLAVLVWRRKPGWRAASV